MFLPEYRHGMSQPMLSNQTSCRKKYPEANLIAHFPYLYLVRLIKYGSNAPTGTSIGYVCPQ